MRNSKATVFWTLLVLAAAAAFPSSSSGVWMLNGNPLCAVAGNQYGPRVVPDGEGGAVVTWTDYRSGVADIYAQRVDASGVVKWTPGGVALCAASGTQESPAITSDGAGGAIIAWTDYRAVGSDIYAQRVDASGVVQWTADGVVLCAAATGQVGPAIASDGAGGAIVAWEDERAGFMKLDIYAQKVSSSGVVQWAPNGAALCTAAGGQMLSAIASDGEGGAIVAWEDYRSGSGYDIYAQRVDASGVAQWTVDGAALCTAGGDQTLPVIAGGGGGGAVVAWNDHRGDDYDVYAQMVNSSGAVQWAPDGVAVCAAPADQLHPVLLSDGEGGAFVTWGDGRSGNYDIYSQRVDATGTPEWTPGGVVLCGAAGNQMGQTVVPGGGGGAVVAWYDYRSGPTESNTDIYAQRISASGVVGWVSDGVALCTLPGAQRSTAAVSDGAGGAIVTWDDSRGINFDIYAQRVDGEGNLIGVGEGGARAYESLLEQNVPNPFNPVTTIGFSVAEPEIVRLAVYGLRGELVRVLADGFRQPGPYRITWDGRDKLGRAVASGVYVCVLETSARGEMKKMVLLR